LIWGKACAITNKFKKFFDIPKIAVGLILVFQNCSRFETDASAKIDLSSFENPKSSAEISRSDLLLKSFTGTVQTFIGESLTSPLLEESKVIQSEDGKYFVLDQREIKSETWEQLIEGSTVTVSANSRSQNQKLSLKVMAPKSDLHSKNSTPISNKPQNDPLIFTVAIVVFDFKDVRAAPTPQWLPSSIADVFKNGTWGQIQLDLTSRDVYRISLDEDYLGCSQYYQYGQNSINWLKSTSEKEYNRVVTILPPGNCSWQGKTAGGWSLTRKDSPPIVALSSSVSIISHELGHTFGLGHSGSSENFTYGDRLDLMGNRGTFFNIPKLLDLNIVQIDRELTPLIQNRQTVKLADKIKWKIGDPEILSAYHEKYFFSYWKNYGIIVHSRTGGKCCGVTSFEEARIKLGSTWKSPSGFSIIFESLSADNSQATIRFETPPPNPISAPLNPRASITPDQNVKLKWEIPIDDGGAPISEWLIYGSHGYEKRIDAKEIDSSEIILDDLKTEGEYTFQIVARNSKNQISPSSESSNSLHFKNWFCYLSIANKDSLSSQSDILINLKSKNLTKIFYQLIAPRTEIFPGTPITDGNSAAIVNTPENKPLNAGRLAPGEYKFNVTALIEDGRLLPCDSGREELIVFP
jgi:hypothetical protein